MGFFDPFGGGTGDAATIINSGQIHKHINKDILDKTTASYSAEDKSTLDLINSDYIKSTDDLTLECR